MRSKTTAIVFALAGLCGACQGPADDPGNPTAATTTDVTTAAATTEGPTTSSTPETSSSGGEPSACFELALVLLPPVNGPPGLVADLDGDGRDDFVVDQKNSAIVYFAKGDGFTASDPIPLSGPVNGQWLAPTDPGQPPRFVLSAYVAPNTFQVMTALDRVPIQIAVFPSAYTLDFADADGDGLLDALVLTELLKLEVHQGAGDGTFALLESTKVGMYLTPLDLDADGRVDLLLPGDNHQPVTRRGRGDGTFEDPVPLGWSSVDWIIDATPVAGDDSLLMHLQRACDACERDAAFALLRPNGDAWLEVGRTPWLGDAWLDLAASLPGAAPLAIVARSHDDYRTHAYFHNGVDAFTELADPQGYKPQLGELDGHDPPELVSAIGGLATARFTANAPWDTAIDLGHMSNTPLLADVDGDGRDDIIGGTVDGIEVWRNLGCY